MLAAPSPPAPMLQGSFLRNAAPCRLSVSLCASISRRISGSGRVLCCDGSVSAPAVNPNSPHPPPPPPPPAAPSPAPAPAPAILAPLPSASWYGAAHKERSNDRWSSGNETFRSVGSRSEPSRSSIPGKFSKYSKPISRLSEARRDRKAFRKPMGDIGAEPDRNLDSGDGPPSFSPPPVTELPKAKKAPVAPEEMPEWMREYQFSYSETPASPILGFRQHPWSPFGPPEMMERPWTGSAPLKPSKKKQKEFDSFNPPPAGKKGVKYVQRPGPFPPGEGPKPGKSKEQILGAPLSPLEVNQLIAIVNKGNKQLNLGRDGLTHNMLDVIHSHWKRSLVCKIKCKGVPTVDMDNVAKVIEDKTGGVIIHRAGGVLYLFRGRNYNYKDRPQIPIMLWKPPDPIYPRLIQGIPKGLTLEEAKDLRARGRKVAPLCKLAKNGVYLTLVADVRAQFAVDDVVRVDCEGMNATDYKKIGAKLKELVPCTLLSFENEQIIMCRNKSVQAENGPLAADQEKEMSEGSVDLDRSTNGTRIPATEQQASTMTEHYAQPVHTNDRELIADGNSHSGMAAVEGRQETLDMEAESVTEDSPAFRRKVESETVVADRLLQETALGEGEENYTDGSFSAATVEERIDRSGGHQPGAAGAVAWNARLDQSSFAEDESSVLEEASDDQMPKRDGKMEFLAEDVSIEGRSAALDGYSESAADAGRDEFDELWQKAIEEGQALRLETESDPDVVLKQAAELSTALQDSGKDETSSNEKLETEADVKRSESSLQVPPTSPFDEMRPLRVDELAKLLAP